LTDKIDWGEQAQEGIWASVIDPADRKGHKNDYIDLLQKMALEEVLELRGDEIVLDFGCGSGRMAHWIAPKVRKVIGLEGTLEMIQLAEMNRKADNVEFMLYDGVHFPVLSYLLDMILSVGVLQYMEGETLKKTVSELAKYLKKDGRFYLIEQVSDNPKVARPNLKEYLDAFDSCKMECLQYYPIRKGRWWMLYLIRYGLIPQKWFPKIAVWEINKNRKKEDRISYYRDYLFLLKRP
jgi:SAM-dependent methyltransferase